MTKGDVDSPKERVVELLRERGDHDKADQAATELPDRVDHADSRLIDKYGIDPKDLVDELPDELDDSKLAI